ncbi:MAG: hypothetical protein GC162_20365 [Planctomycetes bacterium]|nr:hypothetical protein [Planctomycetota bacterium]
MTRAMLLLTAITIFVFADRLPTSAWARPQTAGSGGAVALAEEKDNEKDHKDKEDDGKPITIEQLPAPVKKTLLEEARGGKITEIEQETEDGKMIYSADVTIDGKPYDIEIAPDGTLLSKKLDTDKD